MGTSSRIPQPMNVLNPEDIAVGHKSAVEVVGMMKYQVMWNEHYDIELFNTEFHDCDQLQVF